MTIPLLPLDFVILAVLGLSGLFAAYRGFVNEFLSVLAWAVTAIITAILFGSIRGTVREMIDPDWFADIVGFVGLFLAVVIPTSFVCFRIGEAVRQSSVGPLDRSLGFVYGVVRGLVVAAIAYLIFAMLVPNDKQPAWVKDAKLIPIVQRSSDVLASLANSKSVKGVSKSAPHPAAHPQSTAVKPKPYAPPNSQFAAAEPFAPAAPPPVRVDTPAHTAPRIIPPANEFQVLAPPPAAPAAKPARPKAGPRYQSLPMEKSETRQTRARPPVDKPKPKAKPAAPKAQAARPAQGRRPAATQVAGNERRGTGKTGDKPGGKGYGSRDRMALDQLVRSTNRDQ
jgi:membrane protein required for colicin V production